MNEKIFASASLPLALAVTGALVMSAGPASAEGEGVPSTLEVPVTAEADEPVTDTATGPAPASEAPANASAAANAAAEADAAADEAMAEDFMAELMAPEDDGPSLRLYGFADLRYQRFLFDDTNRWSAFVNRWGSFAIGNLNLYLDAKINDRVRSLAEVRFLFGPNGAESFDAATNTLARYDTSFTDAVNDGRALQWGGISIERAWVEVQLHDLLTIRGGFFITPYGIWVVDHGSPVIIGTARPWIVGQQLFPEHQMGVQLYGTYFWKNLTFGYHATLSNGRFQGSIPAVDDLDAQFGYGGRLFMRADWLGTWTVGFSGYGGRFTDRLKDVTGFDNDGPIIYDRVIEQYDELALAGDIKWQWKGLTVAMEVIFRQWAYTDRGRPAAGPGLTGLAPDDQENGAYVLVAYELPWFNLMPYVYYEYLVNSQVRDEPVPHLFHVGVNWKVWPALVLKLEYTHATWNHSVPGSRADSDMPIFTGQVAWAF